MPQISREQLNGFAPNSQGGCLAPRSDKFECQGQRPRSPGTKTRLARPSPPTAYEWYALAANSVHQQRTTPLRRYRGGVISGARVRSTLGKPSLALVMVALCNRETIYIFILFLSSSSFFFFFSSPNLSGRKLDVYHTLAHGVALVRI